MSLLLDTGVLYANLNEDDDNADQADSIVAAAMDNRYGAVLTTSDIVDETFTLLEARGSPRVLAEQFANQIGWTTEDVPMAQVIPVTQRTRQDAWDIFHRHYEDRGLSFTDCTSLVTMRRKGIDAIASFDDGFDGLVERVDGSDG